MIRDIRLQYSIYMMITGIIAIGENSIDDGVCFSSYPSCVMNVMREQYKNIYEQKQWLHVPQVIIWSLCEDRVSCQVQSII